MKKSDESKYQKNNSEEIYNNASEECKNIIKLVLSEERKYMHLTKRSDIYAKIYSHVKKVVK